MGDLSQSHGVNKDALLQIAMGDDTTPMVQLMGDPLANLVASAGIDPQQIGLSQSAPDASQAIAPVAQPDQGPGLMSTMLGQAPQQPVDNQYTDFDPSDVAKSVPQIGSDDDSEISISPAFKPHHLSTLGHIADLFLSGLLSKHNNDRNMREAVQGFTKEPEEVIKRIATFNPKLALDLQEKYVDNTRQQGNVDRQLKATDLVVDKYVRDRAAGIANTLSNSKDPQKVWPVLRDRIIGFGKKYGKDFSDELPAQYNDFDVNSFVAGGMSVPQAERIKQGEQKIAQGDRRLDQGDIRLGQTGADTESRIDARTARTRQGDERLSQNADKQQQSVKNKNDTISRKYGLPVDPAEGFSKISPDGSRGLKFHNGRWMRFERGSDGNLHPTGYL